MTGIFRHVDADGSVSYSDVPSAPAGKTEALTAEGRRTAAAAPQRDKPAAKLSHEEVKTVIDVAQARIPKLRDYFQYLQYLRNHRPIVYTRLLDELRVEDKQAFVKLLANPLYRPLRDTSWGWRAAEKNVSFAVGLGIATYTGKFTGSIEKWLTTSVEDSMKQQRWVGYADVLGSKASAVTAAPKTFPNTWMGRYLKAQASSSATASKAAQAALDSSRAAIRTGLASSISRVGSSVLNFGTAALDPETASSEVIRQLSSRIMRLNNAGALSVDEWAESLNLLSQGKYVELRKLLDDANDRYIFGRSR